MDLFTHGAAGAFIGWALPQRQERPGAALLVIAGALLPDVDAFIEPFLDPQSGFVHRGFAHALFGVAVLAPLTFRGDPCSARYLISGEKLSMSVGLHIRHSENNFRGSDATIGVT